MLNMFMSPAPVWGAFMQARGAYTFTRCNPAQILNVLTNGGIPLCSCGRPLERKGRIFNCPVCEADVEYRQQFASNLRTKREAFYEEAHEHFQAVAPTLKEVRSHKWILKFIKGVAEKEAS